MVGAEVVATLSDAGAVQMAPQLGAQLESVRGRVVEASDSAITLTVLATTTRSGVETLWNGERVSLPRTIVVDVRGRRLDRKRTILVTVLSLTGVILAGGILSGGSGFDGFIGGGGGGKR